MDVRGAHHHGRDRRRRAGSVLERGAAGVGGRPRRHALLRRRHLRLRAPHVPLLQVPARPGPGLLLAGPGEDGPQLHLHGRRPRPPRPQAHLPLRLPPVRLLLRHRHRLHHHHRHLPRRDQEGQLLPRPRPRRGVRVGRSRAALVHAALRRGAAGALLHPGLPQHGVAVRRGGGHVLRVLLHRARPGPGQDHRRRRGQRKRLRRAHGDAGAEGVAGGAGRGRHRVRVPVHHGAPGDPGHAPVGAGAGGRGRDDAQGERGGSPRHHLLLPLRRLLRLRRLRRRRAGQPPHRLRLLRALLARRLRQRLHRPPHPRRLPDVQPADIHLRRQVLRGKIPGQRVREQGVLREDRAGIPGVRAEPAAGVLQDGVRGEHDGAGRRVPLLQRGAGVAGRAHLLAARHLPPRGDVLRAAPDRRLDDEVGRAAGVQRRVLRRWDFRVCWVRGRHRQEEDGIE